MHIALLSPLPPQKSGIADYVYHLLKGFTENKNIHLTLFSNCDIKTILGYKVIHIDTLTENQLEEYDLILYQLGNNIHYHQYMLALLKQYGGVIHLHDLVLHHIIAGMNCHDEKMTPDYFNIINQHYGHENKDQIQQYLTKGSFIWETKNVIDFPLFEAFVQYADACIVHSQYAFQRVKNVFPRLPLYTIEQLYDLKPLIKKEYPKKTLRIGVFGGIDLQKKVDIVIEVLANIIEYNQDFDFKLNIIGFVNETCHAIYALPKKFGLEDKIFIHGRLNEAEYNQQLTNTDIIVALRIPTMGETSAVVMQGLQLGIPVIVNNVGWYSELPTIVDKISSIEVKQGLQNALLKYSNPSYLQKKTQEITEYALKHFNFERYIANYQIILEHIHYYQLSPPLYSQLAKVFQDLEIIDDDILLHGRLKKLEDLF
jgi:glycosyltransferase involved in cell wall biosynthesis